jgi:hypothetical protein
VQTSRLTNTEIEQIRDALARWLIEKGPNILGSQLGFEIFQVVGRPVRELGGVRDLVAQELRAFLGVADLQQNSPDINFFLRSQNGTPLAQEAISLQEQPPRDFELWRHFSNPKLVGHIAANAQGKVIVSPPNVDLADDFIILTKPSVEDYQTLARGFAEKLPESMGLQLSEAFSQPDFYDEWIRRLRLLSSGEQNLLKNWEILRAQFVKERLHEELTKTGMVPALAADLVAQMQPRKSHRLVPSQSLIKSPPRGVALEETGADFRQLVHGVINLMSLDELRRLPLSAGLLYDASRRILK